MELSELKPGQQIRVRQKIDRREGDWTLAVTGTVVEVKTRKTGSWFAHGRDNKVWLNSIVLRKGDGELSTLNVDQWTEIELISDAPAATA
jgi:hypothetical protein